MHKVALGVQAQRQLGDFADCEQQLGCFRAINGLAKGNIEFIFLCQAVVLIALRPAIAASIILKQPALAVDLGSQQAAILQRRETCRRCENIASTLEQGAPTRRDRYQRGQGMPEGRVPFVEGGDFIAAQRRGETRAEGLRGCHCSGFQRRRQCRTVPFDRRRGNTHRLLASRLARFFQIDQTRAIGLQDRLIAIVHFRLHLIRHFRVIDFRLGGTRRVREQCFIVEEDLPVGGIDQAPCQVATGNLFAKTLRQDRKRTGDKSRRSQIGLIVVLRALSIVAIAPSKINAAIVIDFAIDAQAITRGGEAIVASVDCFVPITRQSTAAGRILMQSIVIDVESDCGKQMTAKIPTVHRLILSRASLVVVGKRRKRSGSPHGGVDGADGSNALKPVIAGTHNHDRVVSAQKEIFKRIQSFIEIVIKEFLVLRNAIALDHHIKQEDIHRADDTVSACASICCLFAGAGNRFDILGKQSVVVDRRVSARVAANVGWRQTSGSFLVRGAAFDLDSGVGNVGNQPAAKRNAVHWPSFEIKAQTRKQPRDACLPFLFLHFRRVGALRTCARRSA